MSDFELADYQDYVDRVLSRWNGWKRSLPATTSMSEDETLVAVGGLDTQLLGGEVYGNKKT